MYCMYVCIYVCTNTSCLYNLKVYYFLVILFRSFPAIRARFVLGRVLTYIAAAHIEGNQAVSSQ